MRKTLKTMALASALSLTSAATLADTTEYQPDLSNGADNFYQSENLDMKKVRFKNQFNMEVTGNLYLPKGMKTGEKRPAIIVGHPMGAVKEQSAVLYAQKMAERGFVRINNASNTEQ